MFEFLSFFTLFICINYKGCKHVFETALAPLRNGIYAYRLIEMAFVFGLIILVKLVNSSVTAQYQQNVNPPVAKFPFGWAVLSAIILSIFYLISFGFTLPLI